MTWREKLQSPFPFYLGDDRKNLLMIMIISLFVVFFMQVYHPRSAWHHELTLAQRCMFGGATLGVLLIDIIILPKIFTRTFDPLNWTMGKYLLLTLWHCIFVGVVSGLIDEWVICPELPFFQNLLGAFTQVALIGVIPILFLFLFLKNLMLKQNLQDALHANAELDKIKNLKREVVAQASVAAPLTLLSETSETLTFHLPDLLYIEADDNYSTVVWRNREGIHKKLLRANLKSMEGQINNSFAIRCHRSYIVNVHAIGNITGNTNGYKLHIRDTEFTIPVSRPKGKDIIEKIQQLRNMMELA